MGPGMYTQPIWEPFGPPKLVNFESSIEFSTLGGEIIQFCPYKLEINTWLVAFLGKF